MNRILSAVRDCCVVNIQIRAISIDAIITSIYNRNPTNVDISTAYMNTITTPSTIDNRCPLTLTTNRQIHVVYPYIFVISPATHENGISISGIIHRLLYCRITIRHNYRFCASDFLLLHSHYHRNIRRSGFIQPSAISGRERNHMHPRRKRFAERFFIAYEAVYA